MLDPSARSQLADVARGLLADGRSLDEVLGLLRQRGLTKMDSIPVAQAATGVSLAEAKMAVHNSPSWADRREQDEQLEDAFWRAMFIECVLSGGQINEPADWAAECRERSARGRPSGGCQPR